MDQLMKDHEVFRSVAPWKRVLAFGIDVSLAFIPALFVYTSSFSEESFRLPLIDLFVLLLVMHTTICLLVSGEGTSGDLLLHLKTVGIDGIPCKKSQLVYRNLSNTILFSALFAQPSNSIYTLAAVLGGLMIGLQMFSPSNRYKER